MSFVCFPAIVKVYCADHTYTTLKIRMDATIDQVIRYSASKLCLGDDLVVCEVKSTGGESVLVLSEGS